MLHLVVGNADKSTPFKKIIAEPICPHYRRLNEACELGPLWLMVSLQTLRPRLQAIAHMNVDLQTEVEAARLAAIGAARI